MQAAWRWWNFWAAQVPADKQILRLNMDETAIRFYYKASRGFIVRPGGSKADRPMQVLRRVGKATQRKALTHIATICDDPEVQVKLPQVLLGNGTVLPKRQMEHITRKLSGNVYVWRRKSSWVTKEVMKEWLRLLAKSLLCLSPQRQPVLLMDALKAHHAADVLSLAAKLHIWVCIVPATMTYLLQPLDTDVFSCYKGYLRREYMAAVVRQNGSEQTVQAVVKCVNLICRTVLQGRDWNVLFDKNGFGQGQRHVRHRLLADLQWTHPPSLTAALPSLRELQCCFPQQSDIPISEIFADLLPPRPRRVLPPQPPPLEDAPEIEPWSKRLRPRPSSRSALSAAAADSSTATAAVDQPETASLAAACPDPPAPPPPAPLRRPLRMVPLPPRPPGS